MHFQFSQLKKILVLMSISVITAGTNQAALSQYMVFDSTQECTQLSSVKNTYTPGFYNDAESLTHLYQQSDATGVNNLPFETAFQTYFWSTIATLCLMPIIVSISLKSLIRWQSTSRH